MTKRHIRGDLALAFALTPLTDYASLLQCHKLFLALGGPDDAAQRTLRALPFWKHILQSLMGGQGDLVFEGVSTDIVEVLKGMLELDPHRRLSAS